MQGQNSWLPKEAESTRTPMPDGNFLACGIGLENRTVNYIHVHAVMKLNKTNRPIFLDIPTQKEIEEYCPKFKKI